MTVMSAMLSEGAPCEDGERLMLRRSGGRSLHGEAARDGLRGGERGGVGAVERGGVVGFGEEEGEKVFLEVGVG